MDKIRQYATLALLLSATFLVTAAAIYVVQIGRHATATLIEIQATAKHVRELVDEQGTMLRSDDAQRLVRQNLAVGAGVMSVIRSLNVGTLPKINRTVDQLNTVGVEMAKLTSDTNRSVNLSLLPETKRTIQTAHDVIQDAGDSLDETFKVLTPRIQNALESTDKAIIDIQNLINDPAIRTGISQIAAASQQIHESTENINVTTKEIRDAAAQFPDIAKDIRAYTQAQSKASRYIIAARVVAALIPILNSVR